MPGASAKRRAATIPMKKKPDKAAGKAPPSRADTKIFSAASVKKAVKKYGKDIDYVFAGFISFFGEAHYVFDRNGELIKSK